MITAVRFACGSFLYYLEGNAIAFYPPEELAAGYSKNVFFDQPRIETAAFAFGLNNEPLPEVVNYLERNPPFPLPKQLPSTSPRHMFCIPPEYRWNNS